MEMGQNWRTASFPIVCYPLDFQQENNVSGFPSWKSTLGFHWVSLGFPYWETQVYWQCRLETGGVASTADDCFTKLKFSNFFVIRCGGHTSFNAKMDLAKFGV